MHAEEVLPLPPSRWYLTGFLAPWNAPVSQKSDEDDTQGELEYGEAGGPGDDDEATPEPRAARRSHFPSSMGLSVLVPAGATELRVGVQWGNYTPVLKDNIATGEWQRTQRQETVVIPLTHGPDERIADLQYRDALGLTVGHGASVHSIVEGGTCRRVHTTWMPTREVEPEEPVRLNDVELGKDALAAMPDAPTIGAALKRVSDAIPGVDRSSVAKRAARRRTRNRRGCRGADRGGPPRRKANHRRVGGAERAEGVRGHSRWPTARWPWPLAEAAPRKRI